MLLSIIIPTYNGEKTIERCLASIQENNIVDMEIIVIDDGSVDATPKILDDLAARDNRIKVIRQENKGASAARNAGLRAMKGDYFTFVDCDDEVLTDYGRLIALADMADMVTFSYEAAHGACKRQIMELADEFITGAQFKNIIGYDDTTYGGGFIWNRIISRSYYDGHRVLFREDISRYEDKIWLLDLIADDARIGLSSQVGYRYYLPVSKAGVNLSLSTLEAFSHIASREDLSIEAQKKSTVRYGLEFMAMMKLAIETGDANLSESLLTLFQNEPANVQKLIYAIMQNG